MWKLHRTDFPGVRRLVSCHVYWLLSARKSKCLASEVVVWCRKRMQYNPAAGEKMPNVVVVWCRKRMQYNFTKKPISMKQLWFDVERGCNTTRRLHQRRGWQLWFDVERGCNTTRSLSCFSLAPLWFDVERGCNTTPHNGTYWRKRLWFDVERGCNTTSLPCAPCCRCCGLM